MFDPTDNHADELLEKVLEHLRLQEVPEFPDPEIAASPDAPPQVAPPVGTPPLWRRIAMNRRFRRAASTAAALAAAGLFCMLVPWPSRVSLAFAQVQEAINRTRSVRFTMTMTRGHEQPGSKMDPQTAEIAGPHGRPFVDPLIVQVLAVEPGRFRCEFNTGEVLIRNAEEGRFVWIWHKENRARVEPLYASPRDAIPSPVDLFQRLRNAAVDSTQRIGEKELDGRKVVEFRWRFERTDFVVTADAATRLPVRLEGVLPPAVPGDAQTCTVWSDFRFDTEVDESLFSTIPPAGYAVEQLTPDPSAQQHYQEDARRLIVSPETGIGPVKFGMGKDEVIRLLGKPDSISKTRARIAPAPNAAETSYDIEDLVYFSRGFEIRLNAMPGAGVSRVSCYAQAFRGPSVRDFAGKTREGIAVGASWDDVLRTYGKPDMSAPDMQLTYVRLGWDFSFRNKRLGAIHVERPLTPENFEALRKGKGLMPPRAAK